MHIIGNTNTTQYIGYPYDFKNQIPSIFPVLFMKWPCVLCAKSVRWMNFLMRSPPTPYAINLEWSHKNYVFSLQGNFKVIFSVFPVGTQSIKKNRSILLAYSNWSTKPNRPSNPKDNETKWMIRQPSDTTRIWSQVVICINC